jgi:hypothetical protein
MIRVYFLLGVGFGADNYGSILGDYPVLLALHARGALF